VIFKISAQDCAQQTARGCVLPKKKFCVLLVLCEEDVSSWIAWKLTPTITLPVSDVPITSKWGTIGTEPVLLAPILVCSAIPAGIPLFAVLAKVVDQLTRGALKRIRRGSGLSMATKSFSIHTTVLLLYLLERTELQFHDVTAHWSVLVWWEGLRMAQSSTPVVTVNWLSSNNAVSESQ
jgi:hypothetical protein